ncbi:MAG TPA: phenylalanine--tRNA ligase subunit beta, partial [Flavobacterium sp.]|nr:phenylalanine--tRNA ligase subunit beta [Flavobacterium sp.]
MKISYNWIKQFIKIDWQSEETAALLTDLGLEVEMVEKYQSVKGGLEGIVVGHVLTCVPHPDADRLKITTVDIGDGVPVQIVCGASNVAAGQKVPVATIGTVLYDKEGESFTIKKGKIRGQESHGMICAEDEIGLGTSHEGIMVLDASLQPGTSAATVFKIENDEVFEIGLTPNRADAMSHYGTARDLRAGMIQSGVNVELITPSVTNFRVDKRTFKIDIDVKESNLVPRYCGVTISGITVQPSPAWLQNRLKAIGLNPKNNIVDVTNYVLHELGQPLHAFDAAKISGKVIVKTLPSGTKFTTLDDVERSLHEEDIMICDENGPLCIAGVFGGKESGVSESTTAIFLESAYFNPVSVRKTAKRHQLNTDASFRFERGIDPSITEYALKRAALLIQEVAGGEITSDIIDVYLKKVEDFSVFLNFNKVTKIIGQEIPKDIIKNILVSLDIKVNSVTDSGLGLTIPAYRVDVQREIDVIEEILRVYGYNNIKFSNKVNATVANSPRTEDYKIQNVVATQLNSQGFHEMMANSLTTANYIQLSDLLKEEHNVTMLNPLSSDLATMRQSLLFSGLEAISYNINRKNTDLKLFEFGKT